MAQFGGREQQAISADENAVVTRRLPETETWEHPAPSGVPEQEKIVVTIARQCGSGGSEVGRILARRANLQYLDHEIINEVARRSGVAIEQAKKQDEKTSGPLGYMLDALATNPLFNLNYSKVLQPQTSNVPTLTREQAYFRLTQRVVLEMASAGDAVIIGRGSQFLLRGLPRIMHVYIFAPLPRRIENVCAHFHLTRSQASEFIERRDGETEHYLRHYYGSNGTQPELYHLLINTGLFSFETAADLIVQALPFAKEIK